MEIPKGGRQDEVSEKIRRETEKNTESILIYFLIINIIKITNLPHIKNGDIRSMFW